MTDIATKNEADNGASSNDAATTLIDNTTVEGDSGDGADKNYEWAPSEPAPKKRHLGWWISGAAAVVAVAIVASSLVLIAPGTAIAGVSVGFMTPGGAIGAVNSRLAETEIAIATPDGSATLTGADLGASIDASAAAEAAFEAHPMWNVTQWFADSSAPDVAIDPVTAEAALTAAFPDAFLAPINATISFDADSASYAVDPAVAGTGIDLDLIQSTLKQAFLDGSTRVEIDASVVPVDATFTTASAEESVTALNGMLDSAGFYVGEERTVPLDRAVVASWLAVDTTDAVESSDVTVTADASAMADVIDALPKAVDRDAVNATVITNEAGDVLRTETEGVAGRALDSTDGIADSYAAQLASGNSVYELPVTETEFTTTSLARMLEVNLSEQRLYVKENGAVVDSWLISSGLEFPTQTGRYNIGWKTPMQTMRGNNADGTTYETPNIKSVMYFNGDQAFHGVYWHNNYGQRMSHGCVGMPEYRAAQIYSWAPQGVDVWIHN
ncbi:lipoprotein-anchoring transpeptidase ErfK/SrfK [Microbacterium halimionae]|uniref:Lipoprotein-anchoring transpeptidase ErfK/SrfK n=1 Tax=Microbacterium halimionae TaxID=1526413 RepID=A0A7W3JR80_9MICO|nr:L,D-transpeptidase [Microbacterium halimionae]MBA8817520.1 lipoprotein-anchoring transpeptidase ErfK/SrfK [Microbacterium halimionae]NII95037.1 lipoprotein-anchoring transpeptidase ErfK/SrfK [Microbacterium halimionae]